MPAVPSAMDSHSSVSQSTEDEKLQKERVPLEPPTEVPTDLDRGQTIVGYQSRTAREDGNFWDSIIAEHLSREPSLEEQRKKQKEIDEYGWRRIEKQARVDLAVGEVKRLASLAEKQKEQLERKDNEVERLNHVVEKQQQEINSAAEEVKRLSNIVVKQREEIKKLQGPDASQASMLSMIIHLVKRNRKSKRQNISHEAIAIDADKLIEKRGLDLSKVCPEGWRQRQELPRLFVDCLKHQDPTLRQLAKTLISRA